MHELKRIYPARAAKLFAIIYGTMFLIVCVIALPFFLLAPVPESANQSPSKIVLVFVLLLYPLLGAAMGWISGQLGARIYNWAANRFGGLLFESRNMEIDKHSQLPNNPLDR